MEYLSRRRFLKISATTFAGVAAATQWQPLSRIANAADAPAKGIATIPTARSPRNAEPFGQR